MSNPTRIEAGGASSDLLDEALKLHRQGAMAEAVGRYQEILRGDPNNPEALYCLATAFYQREQLDECQRYLDQALAVAPNHARALRLRGVAQERMGLPEQALASVERAILCQPDFADAFGTRGDILSALGRPHDALSSYEQALAIRPDSISDWCNRGLVLGDLGRHDEELASYDQAIARQPDFADVHFNRAHALTKLGRYDEALAAYARALALNQSWPEALNNLGLLYKHLERLDEALVSFDKALVIRPDYAEALTNRGAVLYRLGRLDEALASHDRALSKRPNFAEALFNRGNALFKLHGRLDDALASYDKALTIKPDYPDALVNRGNVLSRLGRFDEALASYDKALSKHPNFADVLFNRGNALFNQRRFAEAAVCYEKTLVAEPDHKDAIGALIQCKLFNCDWDDVELIETTLRDKISQDSVVVYPFTQLALWLSAAEQLKATKAFVRNELDVAAKVFAHPIEPARRKLRIAYVSGDFYAHAAMVLAAGLFSRHDRSQFEVIGISYGPGDGSDMRRTLVKAFDHFHDVRSKSNGEVSDLIHRLGVDIAIDLKGHTEGGRPEILAPRPAPIQVSYVGYVGTMAVEFIDYIIADRIVLPFDQQQFYCEKIVHLPDSYQVNDSERAVSLRVPSRHEVGLPEAGFVFCCFNNSWKIRKALFDVWMRLLREIPGSVIWLLQSNAEMTSNLRKEAQARNVDPDRLVFAPKLPGPEYLAHLSLADLFLDTLPYNAHTTAGDALWVGVPVLTCKGDVFASRVAASLLHAAGLPELVTASLADYEALAKTLAQHPAVLQSIRRKLAEVRPTCALFDKDRFRKYIEKAYTTMWDIRQRGEQPRNFTVEAI